MLLAIDGALEHNLFFYPFVTPLGFCDFGSDLGLLSLFFISSFAWCFIE
jgi:hypothetical protein